MQPPRLIAATILAAGCGALHDAPPTRGAKLQAKLEALARGFRGVAGVYVRHLPSGREAAVRADELFPTASMIKIPIMLALFDRVEKGELDWREPLVWSTGRVYPGEDMLASFKDSEKITLKKLVLLMQTMSDNTASLWLQELAGTGTRINAWLAEHGFSRTRVNSRTPGRRKDQQTWGWGRTSPREMAELLVRVREGRGSSRGAADEMYRSLTRSFWTDAALSQVPPWVQVASKQGAVSRSRSEVFLVNAPHGDYVCCAITKDQADTSWRPDNEGYVLLRRISRTLWNHFEPGLEWNPPDPARW